MKKGDDDDGELFYYFPVIEGIFRLFFDIVMSHSDESLWESSGCSLT